MNLDNDTPMKIEGEIDAALKMLGESQPPADLTSRIHRKLETLAGAPEHARHGWLFWVPATCTAMAAVLLVVLFQAHSTRGKQLSTVETAKMVTTDSPSPQLAASRALPVPGHIASTRKPSAQLANRRRSNREHRGYRHVANLLSYPLTRQEKLLVRFAQIAKPADLQMLNPEYQAKVEAQQEAEFAAYLKSGNSSSYDGTTKSTENSEE